MENKKGLIVDDFQIMRNIIRRIIERIGVKTVFEAQNGLEALEVLKNNLDVSFIICDMEMPEMKGIDFIRTVKNHTHYSKIPIIVVSADGDRDLVNEAIALGVKDYITKPFQEEELENKIISLFDAKI